MANSQNNSVVESNLYKAFFDDATLSDLTIQLSDRTVRVHRIVLCRKSEYFAMLLTGPFQESGAKEIVLQEDDPESMVALLRYIYDLPYDEIFGDRRALLQPHAMVYVVAEKYQIEGPKLAVSHKMERLIHEAFRDGTSKFTIHDFLDALRTIVTGTSTSDQLARKVMVEGCILNVQHLQQQPAFTSLLRESADLGTDILGHKDLECGLQGSWICSTSCMTEEKDRRVVCGHFKHSLSREFAWDHREFGEWECPRCEDYAEPECYECNMVLEWVRGGLR